MVTLAAEDDVHTARGTAPEPRARNSKPRTVEYGDGNANVVVAPQGGQVVSCYPSGVGALPPMPYRPWWP